MIKNYRDAISGIVFFVLTAGYYAASFSIKIFEGYGDIGVSARSLPHILAISMLILSALEITNGLRQAKIKGAAGATENTEKIAYKEIVLTLLCMIIYIGLMDKVGFLIMTTVYLFFQILILTPAHKRNYIFIAILSAIFSVVVYLIFVRVLTLILPQGILG